jgi:hypothetical protein
MVRDDLVTKVDDLATEWLYAGLLAAALLAFDKARIMRGRQVIGESRKCRSDTAGYALGESVCCWLRGEAEPALS